VGKNDRHLTPDELRLWRKTVGVGESQNGDGQTPEDGTDKTGRPPQISAFNTAKRVTSGPNPGGLGKHEARAIKRGRLAIDDRIDLHGMTQGVARSALTRFIRDSASQGLKCVLVITGKGALNASRHNNAAVRKDPDDAQFMVRAPGVLRNAVPGWLSGAELGRFVIGFQAALPRDGGGGALYVLLRRG
jgi:DNA-nicking Smr family endonuclease